MAESRDQIRAFNSISIANYAVSAFGAQVADFQWTATSLTSGNRYVSGNETNANIVSHRLTQLVKELIQKGILQGTIS